MPYSASSPRVWLTSAVRPLTSRACARCRVSTACCASNGHKSHVRPAHGLTDGLGIIAVVLVVPTVGLDELRGDPPRIMPRLSQLPRPVGTASIGFHANQARRKLGEKGQHLLASQSLAQDHLFLLIHPVDLKHILGQIDPNAHDLHLGSPFSWDGLLIPPIWHLRCRIGRGESIPFPSRETSPHSPPQSWKNSVHHVCTPIQRVERDTMLPSMKKNRTPCPYAVFPTRSGSVSCWWACSAFSPLPGFGDSRASNLALRAWLRTCTDGLIALLGSVLYRLDADLRLYLGHHNGAPHQGGLSLLTRLGEPSCNHLL